MLDTLILVFPLFLFALMGYFFRIIFTFSEDMANILNKIILYLTLPATIFLSVSGSTKDIGQAFYLPFVCLLIQLTLFSIFYLTSKKLKLRKKTECVFVTAPLISNTMFFLAPFFYLAYGEAGMARLSLYDIGNGITIYFLAQTMFRFYDKRGLDALLALMNLLKSPNIWALILGILAGIFDISLPSLIIDPLSILRDVNVFLPMFVLGFYFRAEFSELKLALGTIFSRMLLGLTMGIGFSFFFSNPIDKVTIILASSAPIGLISLLFAVEYEKDSGFASNLVSYSMIVGLLMISILNYIFTKSALLTM